jgi:alpha-mannosidase
MIGHMGRAVFITRSRVGRILSSLVLVGVCAVGALAQNDLEKIANGGFVERWLISKAFPAEIDAGMWENFNRFNIETLPQKDWLRPFGKPAVGRQVAAAQEASQQSQTPNPKSDAPLPEVGAASNVRTFADATEVTWTEFVEKDELIAFHLFHEGKPIGTAYAASFIDSSADALRFIETDGFLGSIWLNGERIYDGYSLTLRKVVPARFKKGENILIVRSSGVSGDYWRKDGGWKALVRVWKDQAAAERSATYKSVDQPGTVFYLEGFHVDPVYLQDQRGYSKVTLSNMNQYVSSLRADPNYGVFFSEIDYLKPYFDTHPEDREFLRKAVADGRVGTGGAYNQPNVNTIGGEAIIRNLLYGQEMHHAMLGRKSKSLALWDVFGFGPQISQIAAKSGFSGIAWSKKIAGFQPFFYDYSLDGSRLLHRRVDYAYSFSGFGSGKNYSLENFLRMTERKFAETRSMGSSVDLRINAADFTPPWTNLAGNVERLAKNRPQIKTTGQAQDLYFDALKTEIADGKLRPSVSSRDKVFFHVGVSMARSDLKIGQRLAENMTLNAEKFATVAYLNGAKYPDLALDKAWRQIFFGSHHDAVTGTPSDSAFLDLVLGYREAFELSNGALDDSLRFIAGKIDTRPRVGSKPLLSIVVFNPAGSKRSDVVRASVSFDKPVRNFAIVNRLGGNVPFSIEMRRSRIDDAGNIYSAAVEFRADDVPSVGYQTLTVVESKETKIAFSLTAGNIIENDFYRVTVDPAKGGAVTSIFDKSAKREVINTANGRFGNEIAALKEELTKKNVIYPAWELWTTGEKKFSSESPAKVTIVRDDVGSRLVVEGSLPNMKGFRQTITLRAGVRRIDFKTELIDYKGRDELFNIIFPLDLSGGALVTEDRFGTVVRNGSKGFLDFRTNTDKLVSGAPVYSVNNWAGYGSTFQLRFADNGKVAASVPLKPAALVRPPGEVYERATERLVGSLIKRGVSVTPFYDDFEASRRKDLPIEDSTMPKKLNDDVAYHGFRIALGGEAENAYTKELLALVSADSKAKFEARLARDGFGYLFVYDKRVPDGWSPVPALILAGDIEKAANAIALPIEKGASTAPPSFFESDKAKRDYQTLDTFAFDLPLECFATETNPSQEFPKVPEYGVALINNGTAGVSLENPNTLALHLTHTAMWPGVNLAFDFVPENKTHVFSYALYPHSGDWRTANVSKAGEDFNNPLIAVQSAVKGGSLPSGGTFFSARMRNLSISAIKLGGNPQATFNAREETEMSRYPTNELREKKRLRSVIVRAFEREGVAGGDVDTSFSIRFGQEVGMAEQQETSGGLAFAGRTFGLNWFSANEIKTFEAFIDRSSAENMQLGAVAEPVQPVFSRYWMHNMGAAPIGNDAVKVSLRPVEQMGNLSTFSWDDPYNQGGVTTNAVRVQVLNNYQDRRISGEVVLEVPEDWRVVPDRVPYDIGPNGSLVKDIVVLAFPVKKNLEFERASGLVKARVEHDGQTLQDVLQIGKAFRLDWRTEKTDGGVRVYLKNPHRQVIEGAVALITPPETWALGDYSAPPMFPREQGFSVPPRSEIAVDFKTGGFPPGTWQIARLVYNGNLEYLEVGKER